MNRIAVLKNVVQEYAWGSETFLPELLGNPPAAGRPQAELWMGVHPNGPSMAAWESQWIPLSDLIERDPVGALGKSVAAKFSNNLPFLFKILAASKPLSIQVHPDLEQARQGFARENERKVQRHSPRRTYQDPNHKPEILCALRPFWALKGFRRVEDILSLVAQIDAPSLEGEMAPLQQNQDREGLKRFFSALMTTREKNRQRLLLEAVRSISNCAPADPAYAWIIRLYQAFPDDIGVLSPLFMNLINLQPGEAIYLPPGELHAYLEGVGIELMANSDNVLRAGLTTKHMDLPELTRSMNFVEGKVEILKPRSSDGVEWHYPTPAQEFALSCISLDQGAPYESPMERSVEIMICLDGDAQVTDPFHGDEVHMKQGTAIIVPALVKQYIIHGKATIYKAAVPR
ncbi:MAG: mannose-6-phosphate isomerase, class I [Proteobacteria bacterium]|nr:mannose-6-phosphate isomerase, class I [Pseudomonadota bacterium]